MSCTLSALHNAHAHYLVNQMSSMINKVLIFLLIANEIRCQTQNSFEKKIKESSDNSIKIDVKQKYNVTLEGINAALDEARWIQIVR